MTQPYMFLSCFIDYIDFYLYCSRPIQHQYYCIVIVYYCFLLWCWMNIKVEVEVDLFLWTSSPGYVKFCVCCNCNLLKLYFLSSSCSKFEKQKK